MTQLDIFSIPYARNRPTSKAGAEHIKSKVHSLHARIMLHIERAGDDGCTNSELRQLIGGNIENGTMSARLRELCLQGRIKNSDMTRKGLSGVLQTVWILT